MFINGEQTRCIAVFPVELGVSTGSPMSINDYLRVNQWKSSLIATDLKSDDVILHHSHLKKWQRLN
jgi:hypothetical protein